MFPLLLVEYQLNHFKTLFFSLFLNKIYNIYILSTVRKCEPGTSMYKVLKYIKIVYNNLKIHNT